MCSSTWMFNTVSKLPSSNGSVAVVHEVGAAAYPGRGGPESVRVLDTDVLAQEGPEHGLVGLVAAAHVQQAPARLWSDALERSSRADHCRSTQSAARRRSCFMGIGGPIYLAALIGVNTPAREAGVTRAWRRPPLAPHELNSRRPRDV